MKKINCVFILSIMLCVTLQSILGQTTRNEKPQQIDGVWYSAYISNKEDIYYATSLPNESTSGGNIINKKNYTIKFEYPANNLSFDAQTEYKKTTQIRIKYYKNNERKHWWTTNTINTQTRTGSWPNYKYNDNYGTYNNTQNILDPDCRSIEFEKNTYYLETFYANIKNVKLQMAPHTRLTENGTINPIQLLSVPVATTKTHTIKFYSFLTKNGGKCTK